MLKKLRLILRLISTSIHVLLEEINERIDRYERKRYEDNEGDNFFDR